MNSNGWQTFRVYRADVDASGMEILGKRLEVLTGVLHDYTRLAVQAFQVMIYANICVSCEYIFLILQLFSMFDIISITSSLPSLQRDPVVEFYEAARHRNTLWGIPDVTTLLLWLCSDCRCSTAIISVCSAVTTPVTAGTVFHRSHARLIL